MTKSKKTGIVIISILLSVAVFLGLMVFIDTLTVPDETGWKKVCVAKTDIEKNTYITEDNVEDMFELKKVPDEFNAGTSVTDIKSLVGNSTVREIVSKEIITSDKITYLAEMAYADKMAEKIGNDNNYAEVSVSLKELDYSLAGKIRRGDIVNIEIVKDGGKTGCLAENVYVSHVYDNTGMELVDDEYEGVANVMTVLINDAYRNMFVKGLSYGKPYISKILNISGVKNEATIVYDLSELAVEQ